MIDITKTKYQFKGLLPDGRVIDLTPIAEKLTFGDNDGELAQRTSATIANVKVGNSYANTLLSICAKVFVYVDGKKRFTGQIWEHDYTSELKKTIDLTCYDGFRDTLESKDHLFYAAGKSTESILSDVCKKWGIKLQYEYNSWTHPKCVFKGDKIGEIILKTLKEADRHLNKRSVAIFVGETLVIREKGKNEDVYVFGADKNTVRTNYRITKDNLVTRVKVLGKMNKVGQAKVEATVDGKTQFGILQEIVYRDGNTTIAEAKKEANDILYERGKPQEHITVECLDVPDIRKGDKVKIVAGNLDGYYYVKGVLHNATDRMMTMEGERVAAS